MSGYWELDKGNISSTEFFRSLPQYFPEATTFFAEGSSVSSDVIHCYLSHLEKGDYLPGMQTIFPKSGKYRCEFSKELMEELAILSEHHAEPELLDHLSLYKNNEPILEWHDAFANILLVSKIVGEERVRNFANNFGFSYEAV